MSSVDSIPKKIIYNNSVSALLANLCCYNNCLPQGAPTSPQLSNITFLPLDEKIGEFVQKNKWRYTRYADDLTFSGELKIGILLRYVNKLMSENGFVINSHKTRVAKQSARQEVTGVVVNKNLQISRNARRDIRQQIYYIKKFGLNSHLQMIQETRKNYLYHLLGQANHALFINPKDQEMCEYVSYLKSLIIMSKSDVN